jgi:hypothetical protein
VDAVDFGNDMEPALVVGAISAAQSASVPVPQTSPRLSSRDHRRVTEPSRAAGRAARHCCFCRAFAPASLQACLEYETQVIELP